MNRGSSRAEELRVRRHALAMAETLQSYCRHLCSDRVCQILNAGTPLTVDVKPSKQRQLDIKLQELKVVMCHGLAEAIGPSLLMGQFKAYPFNNSFRVRLIGCADYAKFQKMFTLRLLSMCRPFEVNLGFQEGAYA